VEKFFEPSVNVAVECIKNMAAKTDPEKIFIFLAGGFGASPWLFQEIERGISAQGLKLSRPDAQTSRAVTVGAILYYLDQFVAGRIIRYTYGTPASVNYDHSDPEHRKRSHKKYLAITGDICLETFGPTLFKGTRVYGTQEFREKFARISQSRPVAGEVFEVPIIRYRGKKKNPLWMDVEQEKFETIARISADTSKAPCTPVMYRPGFPFFVQELEAIYIYGQTEFKAQIAWTEWGMEKCSDAAVLYDNDGKDKER